MDKTLFELMQAHDYENIFFCQEKTFGLKALIVIHDTTLGPAAGGCRMWPYATEADAIQDALRLARAMTYKNAAAALAYGGAKCVIIGDPRSDKNEGMLRALGRFINRLGGLYLAGVDVGTTIQDMDIMRLESPHIVTVSEGMGGPGESGFATAFGVFQGIRASLKEVFGSPLPQGRSVAVQGVGAVGSELVKQLVETGAVVTIADADAQKASRVAAQYNVQVVEPALVQRLDVDVFSPCALGGILNDQSIPELRCKIVCGCANNQLAQERHAEALAQKGILFAPDHIVSAGGVVYNLDSRNPGGFNRQRALEKVASIYRTLGNVIALAAQQQVTTERAAALLAERRIAMIRQVNRLAV